MTLHLGGPLLLVGAGKMGGALLAGWLRQGLDPASVYVQDPTPAMEAGVLMASHGDRPVLEDGFSWMVAGEAP